MTPRLRVFCAGLDAFLSFLGSAGRRHHIASEDWSEHVLIAAAEGQADAERGEVFGHGVWTAVFADTVEACTPHTRCT